jgi:hypothetical protein
MIARALYGIIGIISPHSAFRLATTRALLTGIALAQKRSLNLLGDYSEGANPNTVMQQRYGDATVQ